MTAPNSSPLRVLSTLLPQRQFCSQGFWITLILFALLFGLLLSRISAPYIRGGHHAQWNAVWISPATQSAVTYYRREWTVDSMPERANIQVEAPDFFTVYVNGIKVEDVEKRSTAAFEIMDIGNYLLPGKNVIAILVKRETFPGSASLLAKVRWIDRTGVHQELSSDEKWRVSLREERQNGGALSWYERDFDDGNWAHALIPEDQGSMVVHPVHPWADADIFGVFPRGKWISNGQPTSGGVSLFRQFDLGNPGRGGIRSAWLGIASTGPYSIVINGAHGPLIDPTGPYMDTYDIGSFLKPGLNTIETDTSNFDGTGRVAIAALVTTSHGSLDISSDKDWHVRGYGTDLEPVFVMGDLKSYPYTEESTGRVYLTPIVRLSEIWLPGGLLFRILVSSIPWILGVFLITLAMIVLRLSRAGRISHEIIKTAMLPLKFSVLALCAIYLLPFDVRISESQVFTIPVALAIAVFSYTFFSMIMSEIEHDRH